MSAVTIFSASPAQLFELGAALHSRFHVVSLVHTDDPLARATAERETPDAVLVVCLDRTPDGGWSVLDRKRNLIIVVPDSEVALEGVEFPVMTQAEPPARLLALVRGMTSRDGIAPARMPVRSGLTGLRRARSRTERPRSRR